jgi:hypothetical protein
VKRFLVTIGSVASILAEMTGQIFDFHLGFAHHWAARFRRRFIDADTGVFNLCEEFEFRRWSRDLETQIDPELQAWHEEDLDPFEGFESGTKFLH